MQKSKYSKNKKNSFSVFFLEVVFQFDSSCKSQKNFALSKKISDNE